MGIAWQEKNIYWVFGGHLRDIVRYDFKRDDGIGNDDHSDGEILHYVSGQVSMKAGVPSHLIYDPRDRMLYIADTGNGRIVKLDTTSGTPGRRLASKEPVALRQVMDGAVLTEVVPRGDELILPSGLELRGDLLYVSDNENGRISAYTRAGERVNYLDTGLPRGALMGMAIGPDGKLYLVDAVRNQVLRIDVPPQEP
jgi:sugar lactone lactonase YvrE